MFTPDLDLEVVIRCGKFRFLDKTGVDSGDGTKWDGVSGLVASTLTAATIKIMTSAGTVMSTNDVLSQIPTPVTGTFYFSDIADTYADQLYNIVYTQKTTDIAITAYTDYSATISGTVKVTSVGHTLATGMYLSITGTTSYNSDYYVVPIDADNVYIPATFVADDGASTGTRMYQNTFYPYVYCTSEEYNNTMFANISRMVPGKARDEYLDDALTVYGLIRSIKSAITSSNVSALDNIQAEIDQIIEYRDVELNT